MGLRVCMDIGIGVQTSCIVWAQLGEIQVWICDMWGGEGDTGGWVLGPHVYDPTHIHTQTHTHTHTQTHTHTHIPHSHSHSHPSLTPTFTLTLTLKLHSHSHSHSDSYSLTHIPACTTLFRAAWRGKSSNLLALTHRRKNNGWRTPSPKQTPPFR